MGFGNDDHLIPTFSLLNRYAKEETSIEYLRSCGAVEAIISGLENHSAGGNGGMDAMMTVGGTLLTKIAKDDLPDAIDKLSSGDPQIKAAMMSLIASLALEQENVSAIMESGGNNTGSNTGSFALLPLLMRRIALANSLPPIMQISCVAVS